MNIRSRKFAAVLALIPGAAVVCTPVARAAAAPTVQTEERVTLEKFVVTGSLIPIAAGSPAIPVTVIGTPEIEKTGVTTDLLDVLRKAQPQFYGSNNAGAEVANINSGDTNGGSGMALRNRSTLVLINGRRAPVSPVAATGGLAFVDVSAIPLAAIERVEILSDGASATYGSDAVSGVVNIILKSNYSGAEVGGMFSMSSNKEHWSNRNFYAVAGSTSGNTSVTISTEWKRSDPLIQKDRAFSTGLFRTPSFAGVIDFTPTGGSAQYYILNRSLNAPPLNLDLTPAQIVAQGIYSGPVDQATANFVQDLSDYPTLIASAERRSFTSMVEHKLNPSTTLFADFMFSVSETETVLNAQPVTGLVAADHPFNPFNMAVTARNRFLTFPRIYANQATTLRAVAGVKGNFAQNWSYDAAVNWNRINHAFRNRNLIDGAKYTELVNARTYNPFARTQAPGIVESMLGTQVRDFVSTLRALDLKVNGSAFQLPGGPVQLGVGAAFSWEELDFTNDRYDQTGGWLQATPRLPFNARLNTDSFFAEARIPIFSEKNAKRGFHTLELSIAARHDIYSTTEDPTVPKYSVRWLPFNDELAFRGTYSESFVAPSLYELYGPTAVGFTPSLNIVRYDSSGNSLGVTSGSRQYRSRTETNARLAPARSRNWTLGVVWSPKAIKGFSVAADWFNIDERDVITPYPVALLVNDVEQRGPASQFANRFRLARSVAGETHFDTGVPVTAPGQITNRPSDEVWLSNSYVNVAGAWQDGMDLSLRYDYTIVDFGRFSLTSTGTYLRQYVFLPAAGLATTDYQDAHFVRGAGSGREGVFPRYRINNRLDWTFRGFNASFAHTYIPSLDDRTNPTPYRVGNYNAFDVQLGTTLSGTGIKYLKGLQVSVGVNNLTNRFPPRIPSEGNQSHDINTYDPIGRLMYVQAKYKF
jgi:iron complex outermembrane receptor protein